MEMENAAALPRVSDIQNIKLILDTLELAQRHPFRPFVLRDLSNGRFKRESLMIFFDAGWLMFPWLHMGCSSQLSIQFNSLSTFVNAVYEMSNGCPPLKDMP